MNATTQTTATDLGPIAPPTGARKIVVRYLEMDSDIALLSLVCDKHHLKIMALNRLGIEVPAGMKPIDAWTLAMCRENGLEEKIPAAELGKEICGSPGALRFMFFLAGKGD